MRVHLNGTDLFVVRRGDGPPVVLVHGSWDDHRTWDGVAQRLALDHTVVTYDRRGHSASRPSVGPGSIGEDVDDLVAVVSHFDVAPATFVGHSYGATICLLLAIRHPSLVRAVVVHEPPLFGVLADDPSHVDLLADMRVAMAETADLIEAGHARAAVELFVERVAFGPGVWRSVFTDEQRSTMVANADTWLDQYRDPDRLALPLDHLAKVGVPVVVTRGDSSPALYGPALDRVLATCSGFSGRVLPGAGHAAPLTHAEELASIVREVSSGVH